MDLESTLALIAAPIYASMRENGSSPETKESKMKLAMTEAKHIWKISCDKAYK
jgi:hypothetical protein